MKKNILFLGFAIPDEEMQKVFTMENSPQVQTHKFNWNLIKGLEHFNLFDFTYVSARPVTDYPNSSQKRIKKNNWTVDVNGKKIIIQEIPFLNSGVLKLITRFFFALFYSLKNYCMKPNKAGVIVYSVHVPFMIVGLLISKVYNIDYIAIWTDPPAIKSSKDSRLKSKLRNTELKLSQYLMKKATKVIALTKYLAEDFAPGKPYIVIEGIIDEQDKSVYKKERKHNNSDFTKVVYTGSLANRYGIKNIVEAFKLINNEKLMLEIYGRGDYEEELKAICKENKNIKYKGFLPNKEVLNIQREADFLINARSANDEYVKYSFPSKTLEYMLSGTPLITTILPGIPDEYKQYVIVLEDNNPKIIARTIKNLLNVSHNEIDNIGSRAKKFAMTKNYQFQGERIIQFIKS